MAARLSGGCHCRTQRFTAPAPATVVECNCSICARRGSLAAYYAPGEVELLLTPEALTAYQWGDRMMTFHHCAVCGCAVYADSAAWITRAGEARPARITLNARLFENLDLTAIPVLCVDGRAA